MAPPSSDAYEQECLQFLGQLHAFHEKRGTLFDPDPRVGSKRIDLLHLYRIVIARGGYDKVSEEKLLWRKLGGEFGLGANNLPALAFSLKTVYYKQLAAYEITHVHGKEPPPREILEDTTAKGGGLLTRTIENFRPTPRREPGTLGHENSEASDDGTPARDRIGSEETPGSNGGRVTRGLRQAPPQRILFQPDTQPSRQSRHVSATSHPPQGHHIHRGASTSHNPSSGIENAMVASYEPRSLMPLTLRPVVTPGNNPIEFARRQLALNNAALVASGRSPAPPPARLPPPGSAFDGMNIYSRCILALQSAIPAEHAYGLHHLVKISMERGERFRIGDFPGLAEALIEKILEVGSLFYNVTWEITYTEEESKSPFALNGVDGTKNILDKIDNLTRLDVDDNLHTGEFSERLRQIIEAALIIRNVVLNEESALYVSKIVQLKDLVIILLNLPHLESLVELRHYALDIAEQITGFMTLGVDDPLYNSLLAQLPTTDRGAVLTSLRAISKISMYLEENIVLKNIPASAIENIFDWTLLNDEELVGACLDFLYQYTAVVDNVGFMMTKNLRVQDLIIHLSRLLTYGARTIERDVGIHRRPAPDVIAPLPQELQAELENLTEPERSSQWLRCLFEEDCDESITQIAMWQAYQARFTPIAIQTGRALLPAADFIKNVSSTFGDAVSAQVQKGPVQKFIIRGIRRRTVPLDTQGEAFTKCLWRKYGTSLCSEFFMNPELMYQHILRNHIGAIPLESGQFENSTGQYVCYWNRCSQFQHSPASKLAELARHIKVHLPIHKPRNVAKDQGPPFKQKLSYLSNPDKVFTYQATPTDFDGAATGIPLSAALVLRNLARNLPKTGVEHDAVKEGRVTWMELMFKPVEHHLYEVMVHNRSLTAYITDVFCAIRESDEGH